MAIALNHSRARGTTKLVLLGIASHDGDAGAFPKVATLAKYANVHPRRVQASIASLVELGEIAVDTKAGGMRDIPDHLRPNLYHFTLRCPAGCDGTSSHRVAGQKVARSRKGTEGYVDNRPRTGDENSTGDENVSSTGDENVSSTGDENVSTENRHVEPSLEPAGLAPAVVSPAAESSCWSCGQTKPATEPGRYCGRCITNGTANPLVTCVGCGSTRRRLYAGESAFICTDCTPEEVPPWVR